MHVQDSSSSVLASGAIAELIRTQLRPRFRELALYKSTKALEQSGCYKELKPKIDAIVDTVQSGQFRDEPTSVSGFCRVLAWNIERGKQLRTQIEAFRRHEYLKTCDVLLLVETDVGMARSGNADVAATIASELRLDYVFAPCYLSLVKGSGLERETDGENDLGLHGNAILSRFPLKGGRLVPLANGVDKMATPEQRLGRQTALVATVELPGNPVTVACVHLDANSSQRHRAMQMRTVLDALPSHGPVVIGGDWNTTTFNSSTALNAILGYWLRVLMGPGYVIRNHYLHPDRWFERRLFRLLQGSGFDYLDCNVIGERTIYYHVEDLAAHKGLAEWVPGWCFPFIRWALRGHRGGCPLKIDWFATRGMRCQNPRVIHDLHDSDGRPLSDHDPIGVDIVLR